jgi:predicted RNA-binding Zn-ribbon protein involved in translation (DUF1610 family)
MKKTNPTYIFFVLIGLFFMFVGGAFLLLDSFVYIIAIVLFIGIAIGMIFLARKLSGDAFEEMSTHYKTCSYCNNEIPVKSEYCPKCGELQEDIIECEYCGHLNPSTNIQCEQCKALLK